MTVWCALRLLATVLLVAIGSSFQNGYMITVLNVPQHMFYQFLNESTGFTLKRTEMTSLWSFVVMCRSIGQIIGALVAVPLADTIGRQKTLIWATFPLLFSLALQASSHYLDSSQPLVVGRLLQGTYIL